MTTYWKAQRRGEEEGDGKVRTGAEEKLGIIGEQRKTNKLLKGTKTPLQAVVINLSGIVLVISNQPRAPFFVFYSIREERFFTTTFTWNYLRSLCELLLFKRVIKIILVLISYVLRDLTHRRKQCIIELSIQCLTSWMVWIITTELD